MLVEVAVTQPVRGTFTYRVPPELALRAIVGARLLVPFAGRRLSGYLLGPASAPPGVSIKSVLEIPDAAPLFSANLVPFFRWVADYYLHPLGEVLQTALPTGLSMADTRRYRLSEAGQAALSMPDPSLSSELRQVLASLSVQAVSLSALRRKLGHTPREALMQALERLGLVHREQSLVGGRLAVATERVATLGPNREPLRGRHNTALRRQLLARLAQGAPLALRTLRAEIPGVARALRDLAASRHIAISERTLYRDPFGEPIMPDEALPLNAEQAAAVAQVGGALGSGFAAFLLHGVTGSGKTEVYLRLAAETLLHGQDVLVLVPEIALISQTERRFRARFGQTVAVLHSGLTAGERFDQWQRIAGGQARVVVGARSALFAPLPRLGLLVVDEEHDGSYKQESGLRYNARDLALVRGRLEQALVVLGSATPSLQSLHNRDQGKLRELRLTQRVQQRLLPRVQVVDLRQSQGYRGVRRFISSELEAAMAETLQRGQQVLLFLNRRGYAAMSLCAACGSALRCRHCDVTLTVHRAAGKFHCHYCGYALPLTIACPSCGAQRLRPLGFGTERVEAAVQALFPAARTARMDRDALAAKGSLRALLQQLRAGAIDILIGTQMVAKGHDFPGITLVGILCADLSLNFPDFRAGERTFQLLSQVAGRAGRGQAPGQVILQTYHPEHPIIACARDGDLNAFAGQEVPLRRQLGYPPFTRMAQLRIQARDPQRGAQRAEQAGRFCRENGGREIVILGPVEAPLARLSGWHRWQILVKAAAVGPLHRLLEQLMASHETWFRQQDVTLGIDIDPYYLL